MQTQTKTKVEPLGLSMYVSVFAIKSCPTPEQTKVLLHGLVTHIGMTTGGMSPIVWHYPWNDMGGEGETTLVPFLAAQPLMESLSIGISPGAIVGDAWKEHKGIYIIIASCRPYSVQQVCSYLSNVVGKVVSFSSAPTVSLAGEDKC
jgi:hypothetical protein